MVAALAQELVSGSAFSHMNCREPACIGPAKLIYLLGKALIFVSLSDAYCFVMEIKSSLYIYTERENKRERAVGWQDGSARFFPSVNL